MNQSHPSRKTTNLRYRFDVDLFLQGMGQSTSKLQDHHMLKSVQCSAKSACGIAHEVLPEASCPSGNGRVCGSQTLQLISFLPEVETFSDMLSESWSFPKSVSSSSSYEDFQEVEAETIQKKNSQEQPKNNAQPSEQPDVEAFAQEYSQGSETNVHVAEQASLEQNTNLGSPEGSTIPVIKRKKQKGNKWQCAGLV